MWRFRQRLQQQFEIHLANIYLFKVNNRNARKRCEVSSKLTIILLLLTLSNFTPFSSVSFVDFEQVNVSWAASISHTFSKFFQ